MKEQQRSKIYWFDKRVFLGRKLDRELQLLDCDEGCMPPATGAGRKRQNRRYKLMAKLCRARKLLAIANKRSMRSLLSSLLRCWKKFTLEQVNEHLADVRYQTNKIYMLKWRAIHGFKEAKRCYFWDRFTALMSKPMQQQFAGWKAYMFQKQHGRLADLRFASQKKKYLTVSAFFAFKGSCHMSVIERRKTDILNRFDIRKRQQDSFSTWFFFKYWNYGHCFAALSQRAMTVKRNLAFQSLFFECDFEDVVGGIDLSELVLSSANEESVDQRFVQISVKLLTGKLLALNMAVCDTILAVKGKVFLHTGICAEDQRFRYAHCYLEDAKTLKDYGMTCSTHYYVDLALTLRGGNDNLTLADFKRLVASKKQYPNFTMNIQFLQTPQNSKKRDKEIFVDVLIFHGLGMCSSSLVPQQLSGSSVDVRPILQFLQRELFQPSFKFSNEHVHPKLLQFSDSLRAMVMDFLEQNHHDEFQQINSFLNELRERYKKKHAEQVSNRRIKNNEKAEGKDLERKDLPDPKWFYGAQSDPLKTLLLFTINSGHAFFPAIKDNRLPHSTECPDIMMQEWRSRASDGGVPDDVRSLHQMIEQQKVTDDIIAARIKSFNQRVLLDGFCPACCGCGIRDRFVKERSVQAHAQKKKRKKRPSASGSGLDDQDGFDHSDEAEKDDVFAEPSEKPAYLEFSLDDDADLFESLKLTEEQIQRRAATGQYAKYFSVYEYRKEGKLVGLYHLKPNYVRQTFSQDKKTVISASAILCRNCYTPLRHSLAKRKRSAAKQYKPDRPYMQKEFYEYSLAAGYDFGNLVGAPKLSLLEQTLLGRIACYGVLIKLNAWKGVRQRALKGHIVAFRHSGADALARLASQVSERLAFFRSDAI